MRANLDATRGLVMAEAVSIALAQRLGRAGAHAALEAAARRAREQGRELREVLAEDPRVSAQLAPAALARLFDPAEYLGAADALVARVLAARRDADEGPK
jgi:3-carboxy-cis,cis-muconate cycloisomerase